VAEYTRNTPTVFRADGFDPRASSGVLIGCRVVLHPRRPRKRRFQRSSVGLVRSEVSSCLRLRLGESNEPARPRRVRADMLNFCPRLITHRFNSGSLELNWDMRYSRKGLNLTHIVKQYVEGRLVGSYSTFSASLAIPVDCEALPLVYMFRDCLSIANQS